MSTDGLSKGTFGRTMRKKRKTPAEEYAEFIENFGGLSPSLTATGAAILQSDAAIAAQMASTRWLMEPPAEKPPSVDADKLAKLKDAQAYRVTAKMPDLVACITAWRAWCVVHTKDGYRLQALGKDHIWQPKTPMVAECAAVPGINPQLAMIRAMRLGQVESTPAHPAPHESCSCGIWSFKELDGLVAAIGNGYNEVRVLGQVSLWGRVVETTNGFRAEKAYPAELWLLDSSLEELGLTYDVPVRTIQ